MAKIIAITNQKGGVGKTTTSVNLSACVAAEGKRVLVVDADPQGNTSSGLGVRVKEKTPTVYEVMAGETEIGQALCKTAVKGLTVLPADIRLAGAEIELANMERRERVIADMLEGVREQFDYIFIDCPPSLGMITLNALCAADGVLIPIQCEYFALEGVSALMGTIQKVQKMNRADDARRAHQSGRAGCAGSAQGFQKQGLSDRDSAQRAPRRSAEPRAADQPL